MSLLISYTDYWIVWIVQTNLNYVTDSLCIANSHEQGWNLTIALNIRQKLLHRKLYKSSNLALFFSAFQFSFISNHIHTMRSGVSSGSVWFKNTTDHFRSNNFQITPLWESRLLVPMWSLQQSFLLGLIRLYCTCMFNHFCNISKVSYRN